MDQFYIAGIVIVAFAIIMTTIVVIQDRKAKHQPVK